MKANVMSPESAFLQSEPSEVNRQGITGKNSSGSLHARHAKSQIVIPYFKVRQVKPEK